MGISHIKEVYSSRLVKFKAEAEKLAMFYNTISIIRLLSAIGFIIGLYFLIKINTPLIPILLCVLAIIFIISVRKHEKLSKQKELSKKKVSINSDEIDYLDTQISTYYDGTEFINTTHDYSFDLDFFGSRSLYHDINRSGTFMGKEALSHMMTSIYDNDRILENQESIKELTPLIDFRQEVLSCALITDDNKKQYQEIKKWAAREIKPVTKYILIVSYIFPLMLFASFGAFYFTGESIYRSLISLFFVINLGIFGSYFKSIQKEISASDKINKTLNRYSDILKVIEGQSFTSNRLKKLKSKLTKDGKASLEVSDVSNIVAQLENASNMFSSIIMNGIFVYHIHYYNKLIKWKNKNQDQIETWLDVIGEIEALSSLANLSFNHPDFSFPTLNDKKIIKFKNLGHPLIKQAVRVGNDVDFSDHPFIILTGSNMSGKSTFLRSLGVNIAMAGIGAPICADSADIHPMQILVSMRLSDSLTDNESYFFAEVKRLKHIMDKQKGVPSFLLLDEILRGTNSDDKRTGTVEVIKKIIHNETFGAVATHDLSVCKTTDEYPKLLTNQCFEVEIIDNELHFDYKLRPGICQNQSATFLMKKMDVI